MAYTMYIAFQFMFYANMLIIISPLRFLQLKKYASHLSGSSGEPVETQIARYSRSGTIQIYKYISMLQDLGPKHINIHVFYGLQLFLRQATYVHIPKNAYCSSNKQFQHYSKLLIKMVTKVDYGAERVKRNSVH